MRENLTRTLGDVPLRPSALFDNNGSSVDGFTQFQWATSLSALLHSSFVRPYRSNEL